MEFIVIIVVAVGAWWFISNNRRSVKDKTIITTKEKMSTPYGEKVVERTVEIDDIRTEVNFRNDNLTSVQSAPMPRPTTQPVQPSPQYQEPLTERRNLSLNTVAKNQVEFILCPSCKRTQPISAFSQNLKRENGLTLWCKQCMANGTPYPSNMNGFQHCAKCGRRRRKTSFYASSRYPSGLSKWCKDCLRKARR